MVAPRDTRISSPSQGAGTNLPARFRPTLDALARTIVPQAFGSSPAAADVVHLLDLRFASAPEPIRRDLALAFRVLDAALLRLLISGTTKRWAAMDDEERRAAFARWGASRFGFARTIYEAVRRLVLAVYFTTPGAHHDIGVLPPLHRRQPIVPWEGPVQAETHDESSVAARGPRIMPVARTQPLPAPLADTVTPGRSLGGELRISTDAVVIGSGAAGAVVAVSAT